MGRNFLAKRFFEHEVTFTFRCKTPNGRCKRIKRCLAFGCSTRWIRKTKEDARPTTAIDSYLNNYADLKNAFGNDHTLATKHYVENGFNEGRLF